MGRVTVGLLGLLGLVGAVILARFLTTDTSGFRIPSESMLPTVEPGEEVTLNRGAYDDEPPRIGDIVIIHPPVSAELGECPGGPPPVGQMCEGADTERLDVSFIDRVVAGPGDQVTLERGVVVRNGERADEPYVDDCPRADMCDFRRPITVPDGHYYVLGDNRGASDDSRFWGPVRAEWIQGRVEECDVLRFSCSPVR